MKITVHGTGYVGLVTGARSLAQDKKADDKKPAAEAKKDAKPAAAPAKKEEPKK